jgi:cell division protein FtsB
MATIMTTIVAAQSSTDSGKSPLEMAIRSSNRIFAVYMFLIVLAAAFTYLVWRSGNNVQKAIQDDADARIQEAKSTAAQADARSKKLENDNLTLTGTVAGLQRDAAKQQERAAIAERALLQLRESLIDRVITPAQHKILVEALREAPSGVVDIWWTASDTDSFGLAKQMVEIFKEAGWPPATEHFAAGGTGNGFFIAVHDHANAPAYAVSIQKAYKLIGIDMKGFSKADVAEGAVQIYIGHKTPAQ